MTTTYGTIPTPSSPPSTISNSQANQRFSSNLSKHRPWSELLSIRSFSPPSSFRDAFSRLRTNSAYFHVNYIIISLLLLFLAILWHPITLIVFFVMMAAWLFLYFLRDESLTVFGRSIDDRIVVVILTVLTLVFLFLTDATVNIVVAMTVGKVVVALHAVFRRTDDLMQGVLNEESAGAGIRVGYQVVPLQDLASSSISPTTK